MVPIPYSSPPPSPGDREPVALGVPRKSKRLGRARQACCRAERGTQVEASERREILGSVMSSCPFARDPRKRGGRMRKSLASPTGSVPCGGSCRSIPYRPTFPLNRDLHAHRKTAQKEGKSGGLYTPSCLRVKGLVGPPPPLENPPGSLPLRRKQGPSPGRRPALVITMVGREGYAPAARGIGAGPVWEPASEHELPPRYRERTGPHRGPVLLSSVSELSLVGVPPNG